ncbi:helix-turn-helix domain-containing protein [Halopiger xanaduensis]|uniref:Bacterio-opsin activator HTH domain protein n=1 Tax=Halopiger xanaduensis (strain DSM 18323 / JCM 14033 / SH-6) TaxID=797210 RepID=F8DBH8_HALXS|nr:helix-turn-helix domain-containing protein [Halopiger xanaduensis]AEH37094.1 Bacterio-opsin activator HTH domain protein [Halopiger xanaduensis SH-6]
MSVRVAFEAASPKLLLGPTLEAMPSLDVTLERQYALDPAQPVAFCRMRCDDHERLERALAADGTVAEFERLDRSNDRARFRVTRSESGGGSDLGSGPESAPDVVGAYRRWVSVGGELLGGRATNGRWEIDMRFPDREAFTDYHEFLAAHDVEFELHRLADGPSAQSDDAVVTDSQREALALALEHGFFDVPRETGLTTIAETLEISEQAVSERLRRGQARLVEEYVVTD